MNILLKNIKRLFIDDSKDVDSIHAYWRNPDEDNNPLKYISVNDRSEYLLDSLKKLHIYPYSSILEIGCNVGRNLNHLYNNGYNNISGVEISKNALDLLNIEFPKLNAALFNSSIEDYFKEHEYTKYDLIFTMAVLEHIHKDSEWIFEEMVNNCNRYILTIEDEKSISWRHFPRNYNKIFSKLGMKQIHKEKCKKNSGLNNKFVLRIFCKI